MQLIASINYLLLRTQVLATVTFDSLDSAAKVDTISSIIAYVSKTYMSTIDVCIDIRKNYIF